MYITQDDKDADKNSTEVAEKLAEIKAFTSSELIDISDEEEKAFNKLYKKLLVSRDKLYDIAVPMRIAKTSNNEEELKKYQKIATPLLDELIGNTDDELVFRMWSLYEYMKLSSDKVVVKRSKQLLEISEQQFLLMVLLNVRTSIEPRLVTDYGDYF
jgi:CRISPR/Cas system-associated protein endoribonuclease Cas2